VSAPPVPAPAPRTAIFIYFLPLLFTREILLVLVADADASPLVPLFEL
jgi:hypothetical protein